TTTPAEICLNKPNIPVCATPADPTGYINWYGSLNATTKLQTNQDCYTPLDKTMPGEYTLYATETVNDCESEKAPVEYTIKPLPDAPIIDPQENLCIYDDDPVLQATGQNITWYDKNGVSITPSYTNTYTHVIAEAGNVQYKATQTVDECEGAEGTVSFRIIGEVTEPRLTPQSSSICEGATYSPLLHSDAINTEWYADQNLNLLKQFNISYRPDLEILELGENTFYTRKVVTEGSKSCYSNITEAYVYVIKQPEIRISDDIRSCEGDEIETLYAIDLEPDYRINPQMEGEVEWYQLGQYSASGETFTPNAGKLKTDGVGNTITAKYKVVRNGIECWSDEDRTTYFVQSRPEPGVIDKTPICAGEFADITSQVTVGIESNDQIAWSSPYINNGSLSYTDSITISGYVIESYGTGYMPVEILSFYDDYKTCNTLISDSIYLAPMPDSKILGNYHVCENTMESYYTIEHASLANEYEWKITGDRISYVKDFRYENSRYIDWYEPGIDTIYVQVTSPEECVSEDTMVVHVYPNPKAHFSWSKPGAEYEVYFQDSTIQDSLVEYGPNDSLIAIEIPYTTSWHFGRADDSIFTQEYENRFDVIKEKFKYGYHDISMTATNQFGCSNTYTDEIYVDIRTGLYLPNAFAPMNPAHGVRYFQPKGFNLATFKIWVYDLWGNLVWYGQWDEETDRDKELPKWDGRYNGKVLKSDTYIWKVEAQFMNGEYWKGISDGKGGFDTFGPVMLIR
ncbi:MAG: hypothetical protein PF481_08710, partial [Bacteroidales bacterium]|nr:hypothetical protein [Bacteroidales bacterium]